jgi:hypothetical protein
MKTTVAFSFENPIDITLDDLCQHLKVKLAKPAFWTHKVVFRYFTQQSKVLCIIDINTEEVEKLYEEHCSYEQRDETSQNFTVLQLQNQNCILFIGGSKELISYDLKHKVLSISVQKIKYNCFKQLANRLIVGGTANGNVHFLDPHTFELKRWMFVTIVKEIVQLSETTLLIDHGDTFSIRDIRNLTCIRILDKGNQNCSFLRLSSVSFAKSWYSFIEIWNWQENTRLQGCNHNSNINNYVHVGEQLVRVAGSQVISSPITNLSETTTLLDLDRNDYSVVNLPDGNLMFFGVGGFYYFKNYGLTKLCTSSCVSAVAILEYA